MKRLLIAGGWLLWLIAAAPAQAPRQIRLGDAAQDGETQVVPLLIDDISEVVAVDLDLVFDTQAATVVEVRTTPLLEGFFLEYNVVGDTLKISAAGGRSGTGSGAFAEIVLSPAAAVPQFAFSLVSLNGDQIAVEYEPHALDLPTAVEGEETASLTWDLAQNFPNPFNPATHIPFRLRQETRVRLGVYNTLGQEVRSLLDQPLGAGEYQQLWDGRDDRGQPAAGGLYLYRLEAGDRAFIRKMVLLR